MRRRPIIIYFLLVLAVLLVLPGCRTQPKTSAASSILMPSENSPAASVSAQMTTVLITPSEAPSPTPSPSPAPSPEATKPEAPKASDVPAPTDTPAPTDKIKWYGIFADPRTVPAETVSSPGDLEVLINKYYAIPKGYAPSLILAESSKNQYIDARAEDPWNAMRAACEADTGKVLYLCSGYRTFAAQAKLFSSSIQNRGVAHCISRNALEGRSEHNLGLALDISTADVGSISSSFGSTAAGKWVGEHCSEYGFILRYPEGKSAITGYVYEPWHLRYIGTDTAVRIAASGLTLEEFYGKVPAGPS